MQCVLAIFSSVASHSIQYFFVHIFSYMVIFSKKVIVNEICVKSFSKTLVWFHSKKKWETHYRHSFPILMKIEFSRQIFEKFSNTKCHENPSCGSRIVPFWWTDRRTDMAKLLVAFLKFANSVKNPVKEFWWK